MPYKDKLKEKLNKKLYYKNNRTVILERAKNWNKIHPEGNAKHQKDYQSRLQRINFEKALELNPNLITKL